MIPLVNALAHGIVSYADRPFVFLGHSMGALVAFELACKLREDGPYTPSHLFVSARRAPHFLPAGARLHKLPDCELMAELRRLNGTAPPILNDEHLMRLLLPIVRADFEVCETYTYDNSRRPLNCPITAFAGLDDPHLGPDEMEAWRDYSTSSFDLLKFPGDHFFLQTTKHLVISAILEKLCLGA
jgi:medium-chain acyl-[acyl-carrier-protein] hydrolase